MEGQHPTSTKGIDAAHSASSEFSHNMEAVHIVAGKDGEKIQQSHQFDPYLPRSEIDVLQQAANNENPGAVEQAAADFVENSPYEEVRAAVLSSDSEEVANTIQAEVLRTIASTIVTALNMFLSMRSPPIPIPPVVVKLIVYPIGCLWAKVVPRRQFRNLGVSWTLNTGPFTVKEHTVITLMANITYSYAHSTDALLALKAKPLYNIDMGWGFRLVFTLSSQLGIALAGMFRRFLVWPSALIWPGNFSTTGLLYDLHGGSNSVSEENGWSVLRYRWFRYVTFGAFSWYWFPGVLFPGLSVFAFATWIRPNNATVNQLFGGFNGLSLIPITFAYLGNPLLSPTFAHMNTLIGLIVFVTIPAIGISYTGTLFADYLPMSTSTAFENTQSLHNVSKILAPGYIFDESKYKAYSPVFLAPKFALNYGLSFAALFAAIVHTVLYHRNEIWYRFKAARDQESDIHMRLIKKYREASDWSLEYPSQLPWWAFLVSILVPLIFIIPCCMMIGITNIPLSLNVISPFLAGYMIPGRPIGVMIFKVFSTIVLGQRVTFMSHVLPSIWACFVQIAVLNWTLSNIDGVCERTQKADFTCPNGRTFFSSSIVWGVIGPQRIFGNGGLYTQLQYFWLLGAMLPVVLYILTKLFPRSIARFLHAPVILGAMAWLPPAICLNFSTWAAVGLVFNYWIKRHFNGWWHTYNYVTAAALDAGLIIAITLPQVTIPQWWGNVKVFETMDAIGTAIRKIISEGETFGPNMW